MRVSRRRLPDWLMGQPRWESHWVLLPLSCHLCLPLSQFEWPLHTESLLLQELFSERIFLRRQGHWESCHRLNNSGLSFHLSKIVGLILDKIPVRMLMTLNLTRYELQQSWLWMFLLLLLSCFSRVRLCATPEMAAYQASPIPGILQARTLEWLAISFSNAWKWKVKSESEFAQSCPTPSDPMDCSLPGSFVHGIFQARVLEWGAIAFSRMFLQQQLM